MRKPRARAVGVLIIHRTDLASYGWEVVRNHSSREELPARRPDATLAAAA